MGSRDPHRAKNRVSLKYLEYLLDCMIGDYGHVKYAELQREYSPAIGQRVATEIKAIMKKFRIPAHWFKSFAHYVAKYEMVMPDHETICIRVGDKYIYSKDYNVSQIENVTDKNLSIEITGKTSATEIATFVREHDDLIQSITAKLDLPVIKIRKGSAAIENFVTELLRSGGTPFSEIAKGDAKYGTPDDENFSRTKKRAYRAKRK